MHAVILAGGSGKRLRPYTENLPKGMLDVKGRTLIERQIELYRSIGVNNITIATGFRANKIQYSGVKYAHNSNFASTNMVETLLAARSALADSEVIVSYADLALCKGVLELTATSSKDIGVVVDTTWQEYWLMRYGRIDYDIESLRISKHNDILEIGKPTKTPENIDARYLGIMKFSKEGMATFLSLYDRVKKHSWDKPWQTSKNFRNAYMTDMLQALIEEGVNVSAIKVKGGWLEFDTVEDYRKFGIKKQGIAIDKEFLSLNKHRVSTSGPSAEAGFGYSFLD